MKTIVLPQNKANEIECDKVETTDYFGVENKTGNFGVITRNEDGRYFVLYFQGLTDGERSRSKHPLLRSFLKDLLIDGFSIYHFETQQELALWLSKQTE